MQDGSTVEPTRNSDHSAIQLNIWVTGKYPRESNKGTFYFKIENLSEMKGLVKRKLKRKVKWVKYLQSTWRLFKTITTKVQLECTSVSRKSTTGLGGCYHGS